MNESYEDSSVECKLDNEVVFHTKAYFYEQIEDTGNYQSLMKKTNLSQKSDEFFIYKDEDKSDTREIKQKINKLYKQALKIDTGKIGWEKEEQKIKNNLAKVLNKEGGCCTII